MSTGIQLSFERWRLVSLFLRLLIVDFSICMSADPAKSGSVEEQLKHIDGTYAALHTLVQACEKGSVSDLNQKLKNFEHSLLDIQKIYFSLSTLKDNKESQQAKIRDLRRQIKLKDELIDSFGKRDSVYDGGAPGGKSLYFQKEKQPESSAKKNEQKIICKFCSAVVLRPNDSTWREGDKREIPLPRQKKDGIATETEALEGWWTVVDMFTFENVGFTHSVGGVRYLTCAECDYGPLGQVDERGIHLVAPSRVDMN